MNLFCFGTTTATLVLWMNIALGSFPAWGQDGIVVTDKPGPLDHGPIEVGGECVELHIWVNDAAGKSVPCRIHLFDANEEPVLPTGYPAWRDHFVCDGRAQHCDCQRASIATRLSVAPNTNDCAVILNLRRLAS